MDKQTWLRAIGPILYQRRGQHGPLLESLEALDAPALESLYRVLQGFEQDLAQGGPSGRSPVARE